MSDMTPDRIRIAAANLIAAATAATPGPWYSTLPAYGYGGIVGPIRKDTPAEEGRGYGGELVAESVKPGNGRYLQMTRPDVGMALAAWLRVAADLWETEKGQDRKEAEKVEALVRAIEDASEEPYVKPVIFA